MSSKAPSGKAPGPSPFHRLSAGSVDKEGGQERQVAENNTLGYEAGEQIAAARAASLVGLERAVSSTEESARYLERARLAFEEVGYSNEVAAQAEVADVMPQHKLLSGYRPAWLTMQNKRSMPNRGTFQPRVCRDFLASYS